MLQFLDDLLGEMDCQEATDPGPPPLRRLNRTEYDNAIHDLTGLDLRLAAETFPPDPTSYGFDNISSSLSLTPVQVEQYHAAARRVVQELIAARHSTPRIYRRFFGKPPKDGDQNLRRKLQTPSSRYPRRSRNESGESPIGPADAPPTRRLWAR